MGNELKASPSQYPEVVEFDGEAYLVDETGKVIEKLIGPDECMICGDHGPWVDEETQLCEMCYTVAG